MLSSTRAALTAILKADPSVAIEERASILAAFNGKSEKLIHPSASCLLRRNEVAKRLSVSPRCVDLWARQGILKKVFLPGHSRASGFRESDVSALIEGRTINPAA